MDGATSGGEMPGRLIRGVGFGGLSVMVINGMVGAGIFALPAALAGLAGAWSGFILLMVGVALMPVVLSFAALARLFEGAGGQVLYVNEAFGREAGFQVGWMHSLSGVASVAANANVFADYLLGPQAAPLGHKLAVLGILGAALAANLIPSRRTSAVLGVATVAKLVPLFILVALALPAALRSGALLPIAANLPPGPFSPVPAALLACYALVGFEGALSLAGEARHPTRDMPRALVAMFAACALLYALLCAGHVAVAWTPGLVDGAPFVTMAQSLGSGAFAGAAAAIMLLTVIVSIFGNGVMVTLAVSRRLIGLESIGTLPAWFGRVEPGSGVPRNAVLFTSLAAIALALSGGFVVLAVLAVGSRLVLYAACVISLPVIRRRRGLPIGPGRLLAVVLGLLLCAALIAQSSAATWLGLVVAVLVGGCARLAASRAVAVPAAA